jgi:hypothetical protein
VRGFYGVLLLRDDPENQEETNELLRHIAQSGYQSHLEIDLSGAVVKIGSILIDSMNSCFIILKTSVRRDEERGARDGESQTEVKIKIEIQRGRGRSGE